MDGDFNSMKEKIQEAIETGRLTPETIEKGIWALLNSEISREDQPANLELIEKCYTLLETLNNTAEPLTPNMEASLSRAKTKLVRHHGSQCAPRRRRTMREIALRTTAVSIILILFISGAGILLHYDWLEGFSTTDEQQYIVQGHKIDPHLVSQVIAEHYEHDVSIMTNDRNEIETFLGFSLSIPQSISDWSANSYSAFILSDWINTTIAFSKSCETSQISFLVDVYYFTDIENAHISFEQSQAGKTIFIRGKKVYISNNLNNILLCWIDGNITYCISGDLTVKQATEIASSLIEQ